MILIIFFQMRGREREILSHFADPGITDPIEIQMHELLLCASECYLVITEWDLTAVVLTLYEVPFPRLLPHLSLHHPSPVLRHMYLGTVKFPFAHSAVKILPHRGTIILQRVQE